MAMERRSRRRDASERRRPDPEWPAVTDFALEAPIRRARNEVLVVMLGQTDVRVPAPPCAATANKLNKALALTRGPHTVTSEAAQQALDVFEEALTGPLQYKGAHLCCAEVYLAGTAPQYGVDYRRAFTELVRFLEVSEVSEGDRDSGFVVDVSREAAKVAQRLNGSSLAPLSKQLVRLAGRIPLLQVAALRAYLLHADRRDGGSAHSAQALALPDGDQAASSPPAGPVDFLDSLLQDLAESAVKSAALRDELTEERLQQAILIEKLEQQKEQRLAAEELVFRFSVSAQEAHGSADKLAERVEGEMLRADKAERNAQTAEFDADELRREVRQLQRELELERRKSAGLAGDRDQEPAQQVGLTARSTSRGAPSPVPRPGTGIVQPLSARQSPVPSCLQGYYNTRRPPSPAQEQLQKLANWRPVELQGAGLREQNGRTSSMGKTTSRDAIDTDPRKHLRSVASGVLNSARRPSGSENVAPSLD